MTEQANEDVNTGEGEDRVTADHDAGIGSSADDMETHNPDMGDFDKVLEGLGKDEDDDSDDTSGGTIKTDDSGDSDDDDSGTDDTKKDDDEEKADIPRSRLNEVIAQRDEKEKRIRELEIEAARQTAIFEGRLAALEKPDVEPEKKPDPLDDVLSGEPQAILDAFSEDPAGFVRMIQAQAKNQAVSEQATQLEEERYQASLQKELDKFTAEHTDFMSHADKLVGFMEGNPIHNAISAYAYEIQIPALIASHEEAIKGVDEKIAAAKAEGIAEGRKTAIKEFQAKGASAVLDGSKSTDGAKANAGKQLETGGDLTKLKEKITNDLLKKRGATG
jgi:hypothetical protein